MVIDPYFGQNAVTEGVEKVFGRKFGEVMVLLPSLVVNIVLVRFNKITKMRSVFTTGMQVQQASTAFWLILFALPVPGAEYGRHTGRHGCHSRALLGSGQQPYYQTYSGTNRWRRFLRCTSADVWYRPFLPGLQARWGEADRKKGKESKRLEDIELPGWMSIFNENMVCTALLMLIFFGIILVVLGKDYLVSQKFLADTDSFFFYILKTCFNFAVYLAILQLGVRTFCYRTYELFQGISTAGSRFCSRC